MPLPALVVVIVLILIICFIVHFKSTHNWKFQKIEKVKKQFDWDKFWGSSSLQGIGVELYGQADKRSDSSYVAVKWFVIFFLPVYPIECLRVRKGSDHSSGIPGFYISNQTQYQILEKVPKNKHLSLIIKTLSMVYGFTAIVFGLIAYMLIN